MPLRFPRLKHDTLLDLAGSRFSEQIFCLSFREFLIGAAGSNPFAHDFLWARNIKFFVVNLHRSTINSQGRDLSSVTYDLQCLHVSSEYKAPLLLVIVKV